MRSLIVMLFILGIFVLPPASVNADGGGWPTTTFTPTLPSTQTTTPEPSTVIVPPLLPTAYPPGDTSNSVTTIPAIISDDNAAGLQGTPTGSITPSTSRNENTACWPIAIITLVAGMIFFSWLRSGIRKSVSN